MLEDILSATDERVTAVNEHTERGIPVSLPKDKYEQLVKDQRLNRNNPANRWNSFAGDALIVRLGYVQKMRGLFSEKRMLLLSVEKELSAARITFIDANEWAKSDEIVINSETHVKALSNSRFAILHNDRRYEIIDPLSHPDEPGGAIQWVAKIKNTIQQMKND